MATHCKTFRFRMEPTAKQREALDRMAGARRWVFNWALGRRKEHYEEFGKGLSYAALCLELTALKSRPETAWLKEAHSQLLQQAIKDVDQAFVAFFQKRAGFPKFKSLKQDRARFRVPQYVTIHEEKVHVPKVGKVRIRQSQPVDRPTKSATFKRDARGRWYVTFAVEFEMPDVALPPADPEKVVGVDLGLKDFAVFGDGAEAIPAPKFYRKGEAKQRKAQRVFSRRKQGSNRKAKAARKVAAIRGKVADQRKDFLHKLTTKLVLSHDGICIEDLSVIGLARTKLAKSVNDASFGEFRRQLTYKSAWNRKHLVVIGRYFPSSKKCNACGAINAALRLKDREWTCVCGSRHDRDTNAARNIRDEGIRMLTAGHVES